MINVSKLKKGIIIDHIESGHGFEIYKELHLNEIDDVVVLMKNVPSKKMGQKDLIKIETDLEPVSYTHLQKKENVGSPSQPPTSNMKPTPATTHTSTAQAMPTTLKT